MEISYRGEPAWKVAYELCYAIPGLQAMTINGIPLIAREIGYKVVFAETFAQARQRATRRLYERTRDLTRKIMFFNTEPWHGEPLDRNKLKRDYEEYRRTHT